MKLFISHRHADFHTAAKIADALNVLINSGSTDPRSSRHEVFLSERIRHGRKWVDELHEQLKSSDYLLLIYTNPRDDWSWCMYEAGYFSSLKDTQVGKARQVFCLHHAELPGPNPLAHLQGMKVTPDQVSRFIDDLIQDMQVTVGPGEKNIAVADISDCFVQKDDSAYKAPSLSLVIKDKANIRPWGNLKDALPEGSYFTGSRSELSDIFQRGANENRLSWAEAVEISLRNAKKNYQSPQFDLKWLGEVVDVMHEAKDKSYKELPIYGLVFTNDKIYSPVIHEISERRDGSLCCEIIFLKWEGKEYPNAPEGIRSLIISIRVATRFRQEFLEVFKDIGRKAKYEMGRYEDGAHRFKQRVWRAFYDVMTESTIRGLSIDSLDRVFNAAGRELLYKMAEEFAKAQTKLASLLGANEDLSTSIVKENNDGFSDDDVCVLEEIYRVFDDVNLRFLAMAHSPMEEYFASFAAPERWEAVKSLVAGVGPESTDRISLVKPALPTLGDDKIVQIPEKPPLPTLADDKVVQISDHRS